MHPVVIVSLLLGLALVAVGRLYLLRRAAAKRMSRHLEALESLSESSADPGAAAELIGRLPHSARHLLNLSSSVVALLEEDGKTLTLGASSGIDPAPGKVPISLDDLPTARECLQRRDVVVVEDVAGGKFNLDLAKRYRFGAVIHIPLMVAGKPEGVLLAGDREARHFSTADLRVARLWGRQAAVALSNGRLLNARQRLLGQRDELYSVSAAIYRPGTIQEILQRIAELAPGPLEVDAAVVHLVSEDNPDELVIAAATPAYAGAVVGYRHPIKGRKPEIVFSLRQPLVVENGPADPTLNPHLREILPCGSLILVPLLRRDRGPLGMMSLLRKEPGAFRTDQVEMAQLFCMRAAAAIETARLYEQTRRDAETKAMLLRELNHRVKNNLAAIVTLLSLNEPDLSPDARDWLDRVVDRVRTMAQAHELFSRGRERVTLAELVDQTVRSLSVARPAGVTISRDLPAGGASLRTDRAVSLAMVLHELCFNAILYGLGQEGTLTIRAKSAGGGGVELYVEDDGTGGRNGSANPGRKGTGIGLSLVRGLVTRELRGEFSMEKRASGGTVAGIRFPLLSDESGEGGV